MTTTRPTTTSTIYSTTHTEDLSTETTDFFNTFQSDNREEFITENDASTTMSSTTTGHLGIQQ